MLSQWRSAGTPWSVAFAVVHSQWSQQLQLCGGTVVLSAATWLSAYHSQSLCWQQQRSPTPMPMPTTQDVQAAATALACNPECCLLCVCLSLFVCVCLFGPLPFWASAHLLPHLNNNNSACGSNHGFNYKATRRTTTRNDARGAGRAHVHSRRTERRGNRAKVSTRTQASSHKRTSKLTQAHTCTQAHTSAHKRAC